MQRWYDKDLDRAPMEGRRLVIFGYGAQGRAQARNLRDGGYAPLVALREASPRRALAEADGMTVLSPEQAAEQAEIAVMLVPDTVQGELYEQVLADRLPKGACLVFAHGYAIHYGYVQPRVDLDAVMVAPMGIGEQVRDTYVGGAGVPAMVAVAQDGSGEAWPCALAYAGAGGHGRAGVLETSFREETETDLFAEQAVLVGGLSELIRTAFDTLVEAGYQPEIAYFCCLHEVKLIADLVHRRGICGMRESISEVAELGAATQGPRIIGEPSRQAMREALEAIRSGDFDVELQREVGDGFSRLARWREHDREALIERVGADLRAMMPWLQEKDGADDGA